jgi:hypothetical protein
MVGGPECRGFRDFYAHDSFRTKSAALKCAKKLAALYRCLIDDATEAAP